MSELAQSRKEHQTLNMMYGTYADILFVLFPFLVIALQGLWKGELAQVLLRPDLSVASSILAGLAIGRSVLGLISNHDLGNYKERIVFFIAATVFTVLGPSILLILLILGDDPVPQFIAFIQPILLIIAVSLYTTAVSVSNNLSGQRQVRQGSGESTKNNYDNNNENDDELVLPRRGERTDVV